MTYTDPPVLVGWSDWIESEGVRLFRRAVFRQAVFRQGEEVYTYTYEDVGIRVLPDSIFEPSRGNAPGPD